LDSSNLFSCGWSSKNQTAIFQIAGRFWRQVKCLLSNWLLLVLQEICVLLSWLLHHCWCLNRCHEITLIEWKLIALRPFFFEIWRQLTSNLLTLLALLQLFFFNNVFNLWDAEFLNTFSQLLGFTLFSIFQVADFVACLLTLAVAY
jgi:hypothetical protein